MNSDDNEDDSDSGSEYLPSSDGNNEYSSDCDESLSNEQLLMELTANTISITPGLVPQPTPSTSAQADIPGTVQGEAVVIENEPAAVEAVVNQIFVMNSDDNEDDSDSGSEYLPSSDGNNEYSSDCDESLSNEQLLMELTANPISITPGLVQPTPSTSAQADIPGTVQGEAVVIENEPAAVEAVVNQSTSVTSRKRIRKEKEGKYTKERKVEIVGKSILPTME
uniref:Uncharacterized protein LOC114325189 n=1 Tax=Diabrotica virgifera virgifera TaxID=50390 RepID=A0A6P7F6B3_DIAVI